MSAPRVADLMTRKVFSLRLDKRMIVVQEMMKWARIRHIPVVDADQRVVGIISHRDLLHAALSSVAPAPAAERRQHLAEIPIEHVMQCAVQTIGPDDSVQQAARMMRTDKIGCLPVVQDGRLVGIITAYDLLGVAEGAPA